MIILIELKYIIKTNLSVSFFEIVAMELSLLMTYCVLGTVLSTSCGLSLIFTTIP